MITLGVEPNGQNIILECGSLHPEKCVENVLKYRADIGICLDGDADRIILVNREGEVIDGDQLIGMFAKLLLDQKVMKKNDEVVGTVMSNLGLEHYVKTLGLRFHRTQVGDRYIIENMRDNGGLLGGEPSGHIIFKNHSTTGDGVLAALKALECMKFYGKSLKELTGSVKLFPQVIKNVKVKNKPPFETVPSIQNALRAAHEKLGEKGRILLRYSGTETLARVMVEAEDNKLVEEIADKLVDVIKKELA